MMINLYGFEVKTDIELPIFLKPTCKHGNLPQIEFLNYINEKIDLDKMKLFEESNGIANYYKKDLFYSYGENQEQLLVSKKYISYEKRNATSIDYYNILSGPGIIFEAYLNGYTVLHASTFVEKGKAVIVIAPSGHGKSTFCASVCRLRNCKLIADDIAVIDKEGNKVFVGTETIKLNKDTMNALGIEQWECIDIGLNEQKRYWLCNNTGDKESYEIGSILFLNSVYTRTNIQRLTEGEAFLKLLKYLKIKSCLTEETLQNAFRILRKVSVNVPVYTVDMKRDFQELQKSLQIIFDLI